MDSSPLPVRHSRFRAAIDEWLQPVQLRFVSVTVLAVTGALLCVFFATSDRGRSPFGPPSGVDFAGFYVAAQILDPGGSPQLYDFEVHARRYHALLPNSPTGASIPYVHKPFMA